MKTNNFKMSFEVLDGLRFTSISFGNVQLRITLYEANPLNNNKEHFRFSYVNNDVIKMSILTYNLPDYLYSLVRNLYYGFFAYDKCPFYKSPALECIAVIRTLQNYCKRQNLDMV